MSVQTAFCADTWRRLERSAATEIHALPGRRINSAPDVRRVWPVPLSVFDGLPFARDYLNQFRVPPVALLRLARNAILAVSFGMDTERPTDAPVSGEVYGEVVNIEHDNMRRLARITSGKAVKVGRSDIAEVSGHAYFHDTISREHVAIGITNTDVVIADLGSSNGTVVAIEHTERPFAHTPEDVRVGRPETAERIIIQAAERLDQR